MTENHTSIPQQVSELSDCPVANFAELQKKLWANEFILRPQPGVWIQWAQKGPYQPGWLTLLVGLSLGLLQLGPSVILIAYCVYSSQYFLLLGLPITLGAGLILFTPSSPMGGIVGLIALLCLVGAWFAKNTGLAALSAIVFGTGVAYGVLGFIATCPMLTAIRDHETLFCFYWERYAVGLVDAKTHQVFFRNPPSTVLSAQVSEPHPVQQEKEDKIMEFDK